MRLFQIFLMVALLPCWATVLAQDGLLDSTFADNGRLTFDFNNKMETGHGLAIQPDGRILVSMSAMVTADFDQAVIRLNSDGSVDTTFGTGGAYWYDNPGVSDLNYEVKLRPDGSIFLVGSFGVTAPNTDFMVIKLDGDGVPDPQFGNQGVVILPIGDGLDYARDLAFDDLGRVLVAGFSAPAGSSKEFNVVTRLLPDGTVDSTFGQNGLFIWNDNNTDNEVWSLALLEDGSMLVCGRSAPFGTSRPSLVKILPDGTGLDSTFATDGQMLAPWDGTAYDMAIHPNGNILLTGANAGNMGNDLLVLAYHMDGTENPDFGTDGVVTVNSDINDVGLSLLVQPDGKIIAAGESGGTVFAGNPRAYFSVRMDADGQIDPTWGGTGMVTTPVSDLFGFANDCAIQEDGKVLLAGAAATSTMGNNLVVLRYTNGEVSAIHEPGRLSTEVWPNPSSDRVSLRLPAGPERQYRLMSASGQTVREGRLSTNQIIHEIPVHDLPSGTYVLQCLGPDGSGQALVHILN